MAKVELKKPIVDEISACVKDAQSVVLVDYCGLTVEQDTQLRRNLREAGITYKVYKNTLMNFAFNLKAWLPIWKAPMRLPSPQMTRRLRREYSPISRRPPTSWRLRQAWWKAPCMMQREWRLSPAFLPGKSLFPSCLAACRVRLPISPA